MLDRLLTDLRGALRDAGLDPRFLGTIGRIGERLDDPVPAPMRIWNARRLPGPAAVLARLFVLPDPLTRDEASRTLGDCAPFVEAGLLDDTNAGITSRAHLALGASSMTQPG